MLEKLEPKHAELKEQFESIDARVNKLRQQLSALDQTFQLHEIQIDPTGLRSIVPHENQRLVPHGQMSRQIRHILANHEGWASTAEITLKIIQQLKAAVDDETYTGAFRWRLRFDTSLAPDLTVAARMASDHQRILDYYLFPHIDLPFQPVKLAEENNDFSLDAYRFETLDELYALAERVPWSEVA